MATVAAITELHRPRRYAMDYKLKRTATRAFLVRFDDPVREGLEAAISVGINFGDYYRTQTAATDGTFTYDSGLIASDFEAEPQDEDLYTLWKVTWNYRSELDDPELYSTYAQGGTGIGGGSTSGGGGLNESPELEPVKVYFGKSERKLALPFSRPDRDTGEILPFVNGADDPFEKVPEVDDSLLTMTLVRNELFTQVEDSMAEYQSYWGKLNADPFFAWVPGQVRCDSITATSDFRNNVRFYVMTYQFTIAKSIGDFRWRPTNKGPRYRAAILGELLQATERVGHPREVLLDQDGLALASTAAPQQLDFEIYEFIEFHPLGLEV